MRPRRDPIPRATEAWWWLGGILSLGLVTAGIVAGGVALWENIDIRQLAPGLAGSAPPLPLPLQALPSVSPPIGFRAALFESDRNRGYFEDESYYDEELTQWRAILESTGGAVRTVKDAISIASLTSDDLLALPEAPCLSPDEVRAIKAHMARGGSVVTNWALGVRDATCAWKGWQVLLEVTGAEDLRELPSRDALYLTVPRGLPTSPGFDPGTRIELRPDPSVALRLPGAKVYWSDWALNPAPDAEGAGADAAVSTTRSRAGGRVTWFGLRSRQGATPADSARLNRLLVNGVRFAAGIPHASPSPWPGAAQAAVLFALDVEGQVAYVNALDAAEMFGAERLPVTFFAVSQLVRENKELARALLGVGEVGSQTVDHASLAGLTRQDQQLRLRRSWSDIEDWTGTGPAGLRPPEDAFDATTLEAWKDAGGSYLLSTNDARSASPEIHPTAQGPVVLLPRLLKDDYAVIVRDVTLRSQRLAEAYLAGARKMHAIGGLAVVAGHTQILVRGPRLDALRTVADTMRSEGDWWIGRADDIARWWLGRSHIGLTWVEPESGSPEGPIGFNMLDLLVAFDGDTQLDDVWIEVVAPTSPDDVIPMVDGVSVAFDDEEWGMQIRIGSLRPGEVRRISFESVELR